MTNGFDYDIRKRLDDLDAMYDAGDAVGALRGYNALKHKYGSQRHETNAAIMKYSQIRLMVPRFSPAKIEPITGLD